MRKLRVAIKTLGCRLNQAESARIVAQFVEAGYEIVPFGDPCDVCVIHGCTVTQNAENESLRLSRAARRQPGQPVVVLAGCPSEVVDSERLRAAGITIVARQKDKFHLPDLVWQSLHPNDPATCPTEANPVPRFDTVRAWVKVQDGCDFRCAYCVVPLARGRPVSRPLESVVEEARQLADRGHRELVLTGANLGCYRDSANTLVDLLSALEPISGMERIRLSSIEITTTEGAIVDYMATSAKVCAFLHLPLQSGDDRILAAMGRRYTSADYRRVVEHACERLPLLGLGTDVIVGFPGEDDAAFDASVRLISAYPFSNLHVFPYSRRPGTRAAELSSQVPSAIKKHRVAVLLKLAGELRAAFATRFLGRTTHVLVERAGANGAGIGWTPEYVEARVQGAGTAIGQNVPALVTGTQGAVLTCARA